MCVWARLKTRRIKSSSNSVPVFSACQNTHGEQQEGNGRQSFFFFRSFLSFGKKRRKKKKRKKNHIHSIAAEIKLTHTSHGGSASKKYVWRMSRCGSFHTHTKKKTIFIRLRSGLRHSLRGMTRNAGYSCAGTLHDLWDSAVHVAGFQMATFPKVWKGSIGDRSLSFN